MEQGGSRAWPGSRGTDRSTCLVDARSAGRKGSPWLRPRRVTTAREPRQHRLAIAPQPPPPTYAKAEVAPTPPAYAEAKSAAPPTYATMEQ